MSSRSNLSSKRANLTPAQRELLKQRMAGKGVKAAGAGLANGLAAKKPLISKRDIHQSTPLSYSQRRQYFLWQLNPDSTAYHLNGSLYLHGQLDIDVVQQAFNQLIKRHPSLRTLFKLNDQQQVEQLILDELTMTVHVEDLRTLNPQQQNQQVDSYTCLPFDLHNGPLLRVGVYRLADDKYRLALTLHHIISDGWSMRIIIAEFVEYYRAAILGRKAEIKPLDVDYADYAIWHNDWIEQGKAQKHLDYWTQQLAPDEHGLQPVLNLTTDAPRQPGKVYQAGRLRYFMSPQEVAPIRELARSKGSTLFMTLLAAFEVLLLRYSSQTDIRIGVPIANRHREQTVGIVGCFINTQVMRGQLSQDMSLAAVLEQVKTHALDAQIHQDLPFEQLVDTLQVDRSLDSTPLFQVMFNHLRNDHRVFDQLPQLSFDKFDAEDMQAQFDLTLRTVELEDGTVVVAFVYADELFEAQTINRLGEHYRQILAAFSQAPEQPISAIELLNDNEREQLNDWGINPNSYKCVCLVHQQFDLWVAKSPDAEALVMGEQSLTYAQLDQRANRLAHQLIDQGIKVEDRVGLALERSIEMVVSLLAVVKAGGTYVPLDPQYPDDRLSYMVTDSGVKLILTQQRLLESLANRILVKGEACEVKFLAADNEVDELLHGEDALDSAPEVQIHRDNLVYVIYTSGSTGRPKGVAVSHGALAMQVRAVGDIYQMTPADRELQFASINFDAAQERLWAPLSFGATLIPRDNDMWSVEHTAEQIKQHGITIAGFLPSYLQQMADILGEKGSELPIRAYAVGGEATSKASFEQIQQTLKPQALINLYGPTETVITPTIAKLGPDDSFDSAYMPIGTPVGDRQVYVLDEALNIVPVGVMGELYIGGHLARGYWQRPGLTAERFIANPFADDGSRLYRTGDLVRWSNQGQLQYLSRIDHQVKIRGFRVELGEIESALLAQAGVLEAVVIAQAEVAAKTSRLIAYVGSESVAGKNVDDKALHQSLASSLPDYMVPAAIVVLEQLPKTPAGKVDRNALPKVVADDSQVAFEAPTGEIELALADIWNEVLDLSGVNQGQGVGRNDNFFERGGDSILSLQIIARLRKHGWVLTPKQLFEHQQLKALAAVAEPLEHASTQNRPEQRLEQWLAQYPSQYAQELTYWQDLLASVEPATFANTKERAHFYLQDVEVAHDFAQVNRAFRTETEELVLTAVARSFSQLGLSQLGLNQQGLNDVMLHVSLPIRQPYDTSGVGDDIPLISGTQGLRYPVRIPCTKGLESCYEDSIVAVKEAVRLTPNQGVGFSQFDALKTTTAGMLAFSFVGQDELLVDADDVAKNALLHVVVSIENQQLQVSFDFHKGYFDNQQIESLAKLTASQIAGVFDYCANAQVTATPSDFPLANLSADDIASLPDLGVSMQALQDVYPLSPMQEGMLFHSVAKPGDDAYINQFRVDIDNVDIQLFTQGWQNVFNHFDVLRSGFLEQTELPLQWVAKSDSELGQLPLEVLELDSCKTQNQDQDFDLDQLAAEQRAMGFDLARPPLMRLLLVPYANKDTVKAGGQKYHFIWTMHHLLLDGWSSSYLMAQVLRYYLHSGSRLSLHSGSGLSLHSSSGLEPVDFGKQKYRDYIAWLQLQDSAASERYWRGELERMVNGPTHLAASLSANINASSGVSSNASSGEKSQDEIDSKVLYTFDEAATSQLESFARSKKITVNTLVQAAWSLILGRYSGQQTVTFGVTVSGRPSELEGIEQQVGLFINTLPLIVDVNPAQSLQTWLDDLQRQNLSHREYEYTPLYNIQRWSGVGRDGLFDTLFIFENFPLDKALKEQQDKDADATQGAEGAEEFRVSNVEEGQGQTNYPLTITVLPGEALTLHLSYVREQFNHGDVSRLSSQLQRLIGEIVNADFEQTQSLTDLQLLSNVERQQLTDWGVNPTRYADVPMVHEQVAHWVRETPNAEALVMGERSLSYAEFDRAANRLANCLVAKGIFSKAKVGTEVKVGLAVERSIEMVVALLAILKAGGAYVPLDPGYPDDRLDYMIEDSQLQLILTQERLQASLQERLSVIADVDLLAVDSPALLLQSEIAPKIQLHPDNLAYLIYTSGSTGKPKGVAVSHREIAMHVRSIGERYEMVPEDRELQFASINFDGAHERTWVPLAFGATLMPRDNDMWSVERCAEEIEKHGITITCFTPSYLQQMADILGEAGSRLPIRSYTVGGEATSRASFKQIQEVLKPQRIINGYGPTETVITPTIAKAHLGETFNSAYMPIGTQVGDRQSYVLDGALNLVPAGVTGELYVGGGLARGYWQRPGLTAERFIANPFADDGSRLYRTGDLVRWLATNHGQAGNHGQAELEYLGRVDHQVKVRGFRIELGEIESQLLAQDGVGEAVVIADDSGVATRLVAYVSPIEDGLSDVAVDRAYVDRESLDGESLRQKLADSMPDYMVPAVVAVIDKMPKTPAGKVDRHALPSIGLQQQVEYIAPQNNLEQALAVIWNEVLGLADYNDGKGAGGNDNFFELGGDSILSLQIIARLRQQGWSLTPKQVFEQQKLHAMAAVTEPLDTPIQLPAAKRLEQWLAQYPSEHGEEFDYWQGLAEKSGAEKSKAEKSHAYHRNVDGLKHLTLPAIELPLNLEHINNAYRTETAELVLMAVARSVCQLESVDEIVMQVSMPFRADDILSAGTQGLRYPVLLAPNGGLDQAVVAVKEALRLTPNQGVGFQQFMQSGSEKQRQTLKAANAGMLAFSFIEQGEILVDELLSDNQELAKSAALHVTASIHKQELLITIDYSDSLDVTPWSLQLQQQIREVFAHCAEAEATITPSDFPLAALTAEDIERLPALGVSMTDLQDIYPLSPMQEGMLFHTVAGTSDSAYINQLRVDMENLDVERFEAAWQMVMNRYDVLRTGFLEQTGLPLQWVANAVKVPFEVLAVDDSNSEQLDAIAMQERLKGFDLSQPPLMRLLLVPVEGRHHVIWTLHHILVDGWSSSHLMGEVLRYYSYKDNGGEAQVVNDNHYRYRDYIAWLQLQDKDSSENYWCNELERMTGGPTFLAASMPASGSSREKSKKEQSGNGKIVHSIGKAATAGLARLARMHKVTTNTLIQAAWAMVLGRYTGQNAVTFGITVSGRPSELEGIEQQVGLFINTLPLIVDVDPAQSLSSWLQDLQGQNLSHRDYEYTPLYDIQRWSGVGRDGLFDTLFIFENYPLDQVLKQQKDKDAGVEGVEDNGLGVENVEEGEGETNFPLTISVLPATESTAELGMQWFYAHNSFSADDVEQLSAQLQKIISEFIRYSDTDATSPEQLQIGQVPIGQIQILAASEQQQLADWGANETRYADVPLVHHQVAHWVRETPNAEALVMGERSLSYVEFDKAANRLANCLIAKGVGPEVKVGLAVERSIEMVVALLAILKAGGAYVPLDPGYPDDRLDYMIEDSQLQLILTQERLQASLQERLSVIADVELLAVDSSVLFSQSEIAQSDVAQSDIAPKAPLHPDNLHPDNLHPDNLHPDNLHPDNMAYVIYTSGSTGKPKGVAVSHREIAMHVRSIGERYEMTPADRELQFASINFDGAHERIWVPLAFGGTLMPRDNDMWSVERTAQEIEKHGITIACFTPNYLQQMADILGEAGSRLPIRSYTVGGEATSRASFKQIQEVLKPQRIINGYGPTETVITPTIGKAHLGEIFDTAYMPIGTQVGDRQTYVLDSALNQVPAGVTGELYVGGGLARGYWQRPGLTAERFIANPFADDGSRIYRTGDLVRWLVNKQGQAGNQGQAELEYLGRVDHQVKVRGFRIELGEIESQLLAQDGVGEAVVIADESGATTRLVAYVAPIEDSQLDGEALRQTLANSMPDYMVPAIVAVIDQLPKTPAGKVDRHSLPQVGLQQQRTYHAPQGEIEQAIATVWQQVLNLSQINNGKGAGRFDSFFELGGDSILSLQIIARLRQLGWKVTPKQVFEHQQLHALAAVAEVAQQVTEKEIAEKEQVSGEVPLLPIQADFLSQPIGRKDHWNQAVLLASEQGLDIAAIEKALVALVEHHDGFRLRFVQNDQGVWQQYYSQKDSCEKDSDKTHNTDELLWQQPQVQGEARAALFNRVQQSLDIGNGQLMRALLLTDDDGSCELLLVVHHLIVDGMSWRILLEDLETAYGQISNNQPVSLQSTTSSYQTWANELIKYPAEHAKQLDYWLSVTKGVKDIPADNPDKVGTFAEPAFAELKLSEQMTRQLLQDAPAAYDTQVNDLLLTALSRSLCEFSENDEVLIDMEGHGREDLNDDIDLSRTLGWFTTLYPLKLSPTKGDIGNSIVKIKQAIADVPHHGLGFGVLKYMGNTEQRQALEQVGRAPVLFNYLGQFDNLFDDKLFDMQADQQQASRWQARDEYTGHAIDPQTPMPYKLNVNGIVYKGQMQLTVTYSPHRYKAQTVERWVAMFKAELEALVEHCCDAVLEAG